MGEPGVGKSSVLRRLAPGTQDCVRGITQARLEIDGLPVALWDIAGTSALDSLNQAFLSGVDALVAVADATRPASAVTALRLVAQIRRLYPGTPAVLLLNKCDLGRPAPVTADPAADVVVVETDESHAEALQAAVAALARRAHAAPAAHAA